MSSRPFGFVAALVAAAAVTALVASPAAAGPAWLDPVPLSDAPAAPAVAVGPAGAALAAWSEGPGGALAVEVATHTAAAGWVPAPAPLSAGLAGSACAPLAAVDVHGGALVAWSQFAGAGCTGNRTVQVALRPPGGAWAAPVPVGGPAPADGPLVLGAEPDGTVVLAWVTRPGASLVVAGAAGTVAGGIGAPVPLATYPSADTIASLAAAAGAGGDVAVQWTHFTTTSNVEVSVRPRSGDFPATPTALTTNVAPASSGLGAVAVDAEGDVQSVFTQTDGVSQSLVARRRDGDTWAAGQLVARPQAGFSLTTPRVLFDTSGVATVGWTEVNPFDEGQQFLLRRPFAGTHPAGAEGGWTTAPLDVVARGDEGLALAGNAAGAVVAAWMTAGSPLTSVRAAVRPPGGAFGPAATVGVGNAPTAGMDADGDALVGLRGTSAAQVAVRDATGPTVTGLLIPSTAAVGASSSYGATIADDWSGLPAAPATWSFSDGTSASGLMVSHAFAAPGAQSATLTAVDVLGNSTTVTGATVVATPAPPLLSVASVNVRATWRRSRVRGTVAAAGVVGAPSDLLLLLRRAGASRVLASRTAHVAAGAFGVALSLPSTLVPATYVLEVRGSGNGLPLVPVRRRLLLAAPAQGVVREAAIARIRGRLRATFAFASRPRLRPVETVWQGPGERRFGHRERHPKPGRVTAFLGSPRAGTWTCRLLVAGAVVSETSFRAR